MSRSVTRSSLARRVSAGTFSLRTRTGLAAFGGALVLLAAGAKQTTGDARETDPARHAYAAVAGWPDVDPGELGNTHGDLAFDSAGNLYVSTDSEDAVVVFAPDGSRLRAFGAELAGGLHGMCLVNDGERELLWLAHTGRHEVLQTTLEGEVLRTIPWPEASGHYEDADGYRPTGVAQAPDGTLFVADGYGAGYVHRFGPEGDYLSSFGGPGEEPGRFRTPHGLWVDTRGDTPEVLVADRENGRLQRFDLSGNLLGVVPVELRRPCQVKERKGLLVVADLAGRVTLLDAENRLVAHVGDNPDPDLRAQNGVPPERWRDGVFTAPHAAIWDEHGNLFVMDWNRFGRVSKLEPRAP